MWILFSLLAAVGFGAITLILSYLARSNISSLIVNTWFWIGTAVIFLATTLIFSSKELKIPNTYIKWFVLLAIIAAATNYFSVKALQSGPNIGIVRTVQYFQIAVALFGAYFFFHQNINAKEGMGVLLVMGGIILMTLR